MMPLSSLGVHDDVARQAVVGDVVMVRVVENLHPEHSCAVHP
jgi:hypothetical protein